MTDERKQGEALFWLAFGAILYGSHLFADRWPDALGTVNLQEWLHWGKRPFLINWLVAAAGGMMGASLSQWIRRQMLLGSLHRQQRESQWLEGKVQEKKAEDETEGRFR